MNKLNAEGQKTGPWEEDDPHGGKISGEYSAGERTGAWRHYFRDGAVRAEFSYENGELNGPCVWFRQTGGKLQAGAFLDGAQHGFWQRWTADGALLDEGDYERGKKTGKWTQYAHDGTVKKSTNHRASQRSTSEGLP